jgi:hypothetical protein
MKIKSQITSNQHYRRSDNNRLRAQRSFPLTDYSYQSTIETRSSSTGTAKETHALREVRSFREISNEFLGAETTVNYVAEAIFFIGITCVAAWPVGTVIHQLTRWMI